MENQFSLKENKEDLAEVEESLLELIRNSTRGKVKAYLLAMGVSIATVLSLFQKADAADNNISKRQTKVQTYKANVYKGSTDGPKSSHATPETTSAEKNKILIRKKAR